MSKKNLKRGNIFTLLYWRCYLTLCDGVFCSPGTSYGASTTVNRGSESSDTFGFSPRTPAKIHMPSEVVLPWPQSHTQGPNRGATWDQSTVNPDNIDASDVLSRSTVQRQIRSDVPLPRLAAALANSHLRRLTRYLRSDCHGGSSDIYRNELSSLVNGIALWDPAPQKKFYDKVSIGDVGYLHPIEGTFIRLFNVILPWDDPSNKKLGNPEPYKSLDWSPFSNTTERQLQRVEYCSHGVSTDSRDDIMQAMGPDE